MLPIMPSLLAPEVFRYMTVVTASSDPKVGIITTLGIQWYFDPKFTGVDMMKIRFSINQLLCLFVVFFSQVG